MAGRCFAVSKTQTWLFHGFIPFSVSHTAEQTMEQVMEFRQIFIQHDQQFGKLALSTNTGSRNLDWFHNLLLRCCLRRGLYRNNEV